MELKSLMEKKMDISYLGGGSVKLSGRLLNVISDPPEGKKISADVVLYTDSSAKPGIGIQNDICRAPAGRL